MDPKWDVISLIGSGCQLNKCVSDMGSGNLVEKMTSAAKEWFKRDYITRAAIQYPPKPVLISAPTGSGKSTFVLENLAKIVAGFGGRILLLTNRSGLCLQQRTIGNRLSPMPIMGTNSLRNYPIWNNVDIITYQEAMSYINHDCYGTIGYVYAVVCDEAHFFCSDSTYNSHTSEILELLISKFFWSTRIYMTATPDSIEPVLLFEEKAVLVGFCNETMQTKGANIQKAAEEQKAEIDGALQKGKNIAELKNRHKIDMEALQWERFEAKKWCDTVFQRHYLQVYKFSANYDYVRLHFFREWQNIVNAINDASSSDKWLIFVRTKKQGEELKSILGKCAQFVHADIKGNDRQSLQDIMRRERFENRVLISTTILYNGINFHDDELKHIVVDSVDKSEVIQMLGRKRIKEGDVVNLYVLVPDVEELNKRKGLTKNNLDLAHQFHNDPHRFFRDHWKSGNIDEEFQKLFGVPSHLSRNSIEISLYAPYQLSIEEAFYETAIDNLIKGNHLFEQSICAWFDLDYSPDMKFDDSLEDVIDRTTPKVRSCFEKYLGMSPFSRKAGMELWNMLFNLLDEEHNVFGIKMKNQQESGRWKADINRVSDYFDLPYSCDSAGNKLFKITLKKDEKSAVGISKTFVEESSGDMSEYTGSNIS